MTKAHDVQVEKVRLLTVRGNEIDAAFVVMIAALKWSKAQADAFTDAVYERHPDLFAYDYHYEQLPDDAQTYRPTTVERISFRWLREINGPEPREKVEAEFAARRQVLLSMFSDYESKSQTLSDGLNWCVS